MLKVLLVLVLVGSAIYLLVRSVQGRSNGGGGSKSRPPARPVAPDDNPGFLRGLDQQLDDRPHLDPGKPDGPLPEPEPPPHS